MRCGCAFSEQAEEGSDEVYCQVLLVPESEVRLIYGVNFTLVQFGFGGSLQKDISTYLCLKGHIKFK